MSSSNGSQGSDGYSSTQRYLVPGSVVGGRYTLVRPIGHGGMGQVWEAEDIGIRRRVALKLLKAELALNPDFVRRFKREAKLAASIVHPNSVAIHECGQRRDGSFFIVQELLRGQSLRDHLQENENGRLTLAETFDLLVPIMGALVVAHRKGIVHRDIKPENIFLARSDDDRIVPKVIDYGLALEPETLGAHATTFQHRMGTLLYMPPEQLNGDFNDVRVDVWAVGTVLFEVLAGRCPFDAETRRAVHANLLSSEAPAPRLDSVVPDVPEALTLLVARALERNREHRFRNMGVFLRALLTLIRRMDPGFAGKHPSLPPLDELELGSEDLAVESVPPPLSVRSLRPVARPEMEYVDVQGPTIAAPDYWMGFAQDALRVNALEVAIEFAERAIQADGARRGQMRLVQAIAGRWLGKFADAEQWARQAIGELRYGSALWCSAIGHLALVLGPVGKHHELPGFARELLQARSEGEPSGAYVIALNRLMVQFLHTGDVVEARRLADEVRALVPRLPIIDEEVKAWINVGYAELEANRGDLTAYLKRLDLAVAAFLAAGEARNACLQKANIGNAYLQLGCYERAESCLRDALIIGEPMRLYLIGPVQVNLGFTLARLGRLDEALKVESAALDLCAQFGHVRVSAFAHIYMAEIHRLRGDLPAAEEAARRGVDSAISTGQRAYALGTRAHVELERGHAAEALKLACQAMDLLQKLEGVVDESDSLIRLVHILALESTGGQTLALEYAREALRGLRERADRIADPILRQSFLERVPENARIGALIRPL